MPLLPCKVFLWSSGRARAVDCLPGSRLALGLGPLKTQGSQGSGPGRAAILRIAALHPASGLVALLECQPVVRLV